MPADPPRGGTVYGAGGAPAGPSPAPRRDRLMLAAVATGILGVLAGVLFATGLTPFGPHEPDGLAATGPAAWKGGPSGAPASPSAPAATTAEPTTAAPPTGPPATGTLRSVASSLCLEVSAHPGVDGAPVQQMPCTGGPAQSWRLDRAGDVLTIVNTATGGCLDVAGASRDNQAPVHQWSCQDVPQQRWRARASGNAVALVSLVSDKCLDLPGSSGDQGVRVQQFDCNGTGAQQWLLPG